MDEKSGKVVLSVITETKVKVFDISLETLSSPAPINIYIVQFLYLITFFGT
jgi:hypothetical protein